VADQDGQSGGSGGRISARQLDLLLRELDVLPTLPAVAASLLEAAARACTDRQIADEVLPIVRADASLTAWVLRNAARDTTRQVETVAQAGELIGLEELRDTLLASVFPAVSDDMLPDGLDLQEFWLHCLAVAVVSGKLAQMLPHPLDGDLAFTCGLLHDVGKLALATLLPKSYRRVLAPARYPPANVAESERMIIGQDHTVAGRRLAELWRFPQAVQQAIWLHHQPLEALPESASGRRLAAVVALADALCRQQEGGLAVNYAAARPPVELASEMGISEKNLSEAAELLEEELVRHKRLCGLDKPHDPSRSLSALAGANVELSRANSQLRREIRQLEKKAATFDRLARFASALREGPTVVDVLSGIAAAASEAIATAAGPVLAYSLDSQAGLIFAVRASAHGAVTWRTVAAAELTDKAKRAEDIELSAADIEAILNDPDRPEGWLDPAAYRHQGLVFAGRRIGGILLPPGAACDDLLAETVSVTLALAQAADRATTLGDELASAAGKIATRQSELADARILDAAGQMAAGAAHEINTPLAVISGRAQLMAHRTADEQEKQTWQLIADQAQRISDVVTDLMEFASPPPPSPEVLDARELIDQAVSTFHNSDHPQAASVGVDIDTVDAPLLVRVDRDQVRDALVELIANAAAVTKPGESVRLAVEVDPSGRSAVITVADSGPGMDVKTVEKAFTPLVSLQQAGRRRGMGLPRAKRRIESNGGTIWIDSTPGEGTRVHVQLPLVKS